MAEEFLQGGVCGGSWWNSPQNLFSSSPCSLASNDIGSFGWASHELIVEMKSVRSADDSASDGSSSAVVHNPDHQPPRADGIDLSSSTTRRHWNQDLLCSRDSGRSEENYSNFLLDSSMNYRPQISKDYIEDSSIDTLKQSLNSISSSAECVTTCPGLSAGFPLSSDSYSYASSLLQTLFDTDSQPQQSLLDNQTANTYQQQANSNGFLPSLPIVRQQPTGNRSPLWNSTAAALNNVPSTFLPSPQSQFIPSSLSTNQKPDMHSIGAKQQHEEGNDLATVMKKVSHDPAYKRPRIETPSPLPTFKVRKEKLGDRITALQQLVSPFGKTDTASVLHEAIEYIKFLHDQVNALSTPYLKYGSPPVQQRQQGADKPKDQQALTKELKTRGLCLVPISSTFPVASETTTDFWTPTFGGSFR